MRRRGVEHLSYFQVDNPLVHAIDPLFLGLHDLTGSEMSSKMIPKAGPMEKVGNFVIGDGKLQVIEYSDLPETLANQKNPDGSLRFNAGSIAIHALRRDFIERLNQGGPIAAPVAPRGKEGPVRQRPRRACEARARRTRSSSSSSSSTRSRWRRTRSCTRPTGPKSFRR
jgi:UDP-N-acetylglucosamine/UDP-N-acetylgalactosamine diphosphorylase